MAASGYTTVSASNLKNAKGTTLADGSIYFTPVNSTTREEIAFRSGGSNSGPTSKATVSASVSNGAFSIDLADAFLTSPQYIGYRVRLIDADTGGDCLDAGYGCIQPTGSEWKLDNFDPVHSTPMVTIQSGPVGMNFRGEFTADTSYTGRDTFVYGGSFYLVQAPFTSGPAFSLTDPITLLTAGGSPDAAAAAIQARGYATAQSALQIASSPTRASFDSQTPLGHCILSAVPTTADSWVEDIEVNIKAMTGSSGTVTIVTADVVNPPSFYRTVKLLDLPVNGLGYRKYYAGVDFAPFVARRNSLRGYTSNDVQVGFNSTEGGPYYDAQTEPGALGNLFIVLRRTAPFALSFSVTLRPTVNFGLARDVAAVMPERTSYVQGDFSQSGYQTINNDNLFVLQPMEQSGYLNKITYYAAGSDTSSVSFYFMEADATTPGKWNRVTTPVSQRVTTTGVGSLVRGVDFDDVFVKVGWVMVCLQIDARLSFNGNIYGAGVIGTPMSSPSCYFFDGSNVLDTLLLSGANATATGSVGMSCELESAEPALTHRDMVDAKRQSTVMLREKFAGTFLASEWRPSAAGDWTANDALISPTLGSAGNSTLIGTRAYAVDKRVIRAVFEITTANTMLYFGWSELASADGSLATSFLINAAASTFVIRDYQGNITQNGTLGFPLQLGRKYMAVMTAIPRQNLFQVFDMTSGAASPLLTDGTPTGGGSAPSGTMVDFPVFGLILGSYKVYEFTILASHVDPFVYVIGDSNTFGAGRTQYQRWANLLQTQLGQTIAIGGRGGAGMYEACLRAYSELPYMRPKYVILAMGTNDAGSYGTSVANFTAYLQAFYFQCKRLGIELICADIPPSSSSTGNAALRAGFNAAIYALGVPVLKFALALSVNNDGVTVNTPLYNADQLHFAPAGDIAVLARFAVDVPFLFD